MVMSTMSAPIPAQGPWGSSPTASGPGGKEGSAPQQRVLLIDEVDVFFRGDFYGNAYKPLAMFQDPAVHALVQCIWERRAEKYEPSRGLLIGRAILYRYYTRGVLGAADAQTAHHATFSAAPAHQILGSANAETTPAGAPAAAADRKQRPDATCEGKKG